MKYAHKEIGMKRPEVYVAIVVLSCIIVFLPPSNQAWLYKLDVFSSASVEDSKSKSSALPNHEKKEYEQSNKAIPASTTLLQALTSKKIQGYTYYSLEDMKQQLKVQAKVQDKDGILTLTSNTYTYELVRDVPVYMKNGLYFPLKAAPYWDQKGIWLPEEVVIDTANPASSSTVASLSPTDYQEKLRKTTQFSPKEISQYLSFVANPIKGAKVSVRDAHLPGAARTYRKGVHEGIDWYSYGSGIQIDKKTKVYSMDAGVVVRADHDYKEMTTAEREKVLAIGRANKGQTPQYILDRLRGCSVWIQHSNGLMARYVHLDRIDDSIQVGTKIQPGQFIGYVGNSGTSDGAEGSTDGLHLHLDLFIYGDWFWKNYTMTERRLILEKVFHSK